VFQFGDAPNLGSLGGKKLNKPIVGIAATPSGRGFYLVASDGGIFTFGDATYLGSMGAVKLNQPVVGMAVHPTGQGYYLVARDGADRQRVLAARPRRRAVRLRRRRLLARAGS